MKAEEPIQKPKRSFFNRMLRVLLILALLVVVVLTSLSGLLYLYRDEVKAAILSELNKHLNAEVRIDPVNIDLTIIKTFPDCSMEFKDVLMLEALPARNRDTLLFAGVVNLHFNVRDLWNKNYHIDKISVQDGCAKPVILKNGKNNYTFWKESRESESAAVKFKLENVRIKNMRVLYKDRKNLIKTDLQIHELDLTGEFNKENYTLRSKCKMLLGELTSGNRTFLREKDLVLGVELDVTRHLYAFRHADLNINGLAIELGGKFSYKDSLENLGLDFNAPGLDIASLLSLLPEQYRDRTRDYKSTGEFYAHGQLAYKNSNSYSFRSAFGVKNGKVTYVPNATEARNIQLQGSIKTDPINSQLVLEEFNLMLRNDTLKGAITVKNFRQPHVDLSLRASVDLEELHKFWPVDTLTRLKGHLNVVTKVQGELKDLRSHAFSDKVALDLLANVKNLEVQFKGDDKMYAVERCRLTARERQVEVQDLRLKRASSDMVLNGTMPGLFNYIVDRKAPLIIKGNLTAGFIRLEDFIGDRQTSATPNAEPVIPREVTFVLDANIAKFTFGKFTATNISGDIEIKGQKAIINEMRLQAMDGEATINVFADNSGKMLDVVVQSNLKDINIRKLFTEMNNFGQATLEDRNIKGFASATIDFSGRWSNELVSDPKSLISSCDLKITKGELIDFKPLLVLSKFIDVKELQHISFSAMESKIEIRNGAIMIPRTIIKNSALNIDFWGTHNFNDNIDYHFQLLISELLAKKRKKQENEFGEVANDPENRRSAFVLMTGTLDDPIVKYDKQGLKEKIKNDIRHEKQNIRKILKEEFVTFRKEDAEPEYRRVPEAAIEVPSQKEKPSKTLELRKKEEDDDF